MTQAPGADWRANLQNDISLISCANVKPQTLITELTRALDGSAENGQWRSFRSPCVGEVGQLIDSNGHHDVCIEYGNETVGRAELEKLRALVPHFTAITRIKSFVAGTGELNVTLNLVNRY